MSNAKNAIMKKKIEGVVYDLLVKTSAEQVVYDNTTLKAKVEEIVGNITNLTSGKADANEVVTAIVASSANGKVTFTKNGANTDVAIKGVVVSPTYDEDSRTLTLPVTKADGTTENVVMSLGKDMVVKPGSHYDETTKNIVLVLTDDSTVEIPAGALVDVYTGGTTSSVVVSVSDTNVITAQVRKSAKEGNALQIIETEEEEGLFVPTPETYDDSALSGRVGALESDNTTNKADIAKLKTDVATAQSTANDAKTEASNAKTLAATKSRIIVSETEPADLTENDLWMQII